MQILINIPDEQIKKSLEESQYTNEDEGEKSSVHIEMLYTNGQLDFVDVSRKTDFYSCKYKVLPKGHGRLIDADALLKDVRDNSESYFADDFAHEWVDAAPTVLEAESEEP